MAVRITSSVLYAQGLFWSLFDSPLCTLHRLSHLPFHSPHFHLHLPCGLVRGEVPCALPQMRSKALWLTTILSRTHRNPDVTTTRTTRPRQHTRQSSSTCTSNHACTSWRFDLISPWRLDHTGGSWTHTVHHFLYRGTREVAQQRNRCTHQGHIQLLTIT